MTARHERSPCTENHSLSEPATTVRPAPKGQNACAGPPQSGYALPASPRTRVLILIDAGFSPCLSRSTKAHGTASSLLKGGCSPRYGGTKGGLNSKLHAVCDGRGWPVRLLLTEGQQNDHKGAAALLPDLPPAAELIGDRGDDSDGYREALGARGITPCIPPRARRRHPATYCKTSYQQRHKIESLFASLKDWRRIATRYDRCAHAFFSAICIAAVVIFCINQ